MLRGLISSERVRGRGEATAPGSHISVPGRGEQQRCSLPEGRGGIGWREAVSRVCPPARWAAEVLSPRAVLLHGLWLVRLASISPPGLAAEGGQGPPAAGTPAPHPSSTVAASLAGAQRLGQAVGCSPVVWKNCSAWSAASGRLGVCHPQHGNKRFPNQICTWQR